MEDSESLGRTLEVMEHTGALDQVKLAEAEVRDVLDPVVDPDDVLEVPNVRPAPRDGEAHRAEVQVHDLRVRVVQLLREEHGGRPSSASGYQGAELSSVPNRDYLYIILL